MPVGLGDGWVLLPVDHGGVRFVLHAPGSATWEPVPPPPGRDPDGALVVPTTSGVVVWGPAFETADGELDADPYDEAAAWLLHV